MWLLQLYGDNFANCPILVLWTDICAPLVGGGTSWSPRHFLDVPQLAGRGRHECSAALLDTLVSGRKVFYRLVRSHRRTHGRCDISEPRGSVISDGIVLIERW